MINGNLTMVSTYFGGDKRTATLHKDGQQFEWKKSNDPVKTYRPKEPIDYEDIKKNW